jgi:hypothetical protein
MGGQRTMMESQRGLKDGQKTLPKMWRRRRFQIQRKKGIHMGTATTMAIGKSTLRFCFIQAHHFIKTKSQRIKIFAEHSGTSARSSRIITGF